MRDHGSMPGGMRQPAMEDIQRYNYTLDHWSIKCGAIGSLQTLSCIPTEAGASFEVDAAFVFRMSPLRRNSYLDVLIELFAFVVPLRHVYGSDWTDFIKAGLDESTTFGTDSLQASAELHCVGFPISANIAIPKWLARSYMMIHNRYLKDPQVSDAAVTYLGTLAAGNDGLLYGLPCCHLKRTWNCGIVSSLATTDYRFALVDTDKIDLYDMTAQQGRLKTEQGRDWFAVLRYQDVLEFSWKAGSGLNIDADQRPELIGHTKQWLSGADVDGTDQATLGTYSGKMSGTARIAWPSRYVREHSTIWIMALLRYPPIFSYETHYLVVKSEPTYKQISGDPDIGRREPPVTLLASDAFHGNDSTDLGKVPYYNWYREHPNMMHKNFVDSAGHPFINPGAIGSRANAVTIPSTQYDGVFQSLQLKHWNCQGYIAVDKKSFIPPAESSIFAGTE